MWITKYIRAWQGKKLNSEAFLTLPEGDRFSLGTSVQGRQIEGIRLGTGPIKLVLVGAIHGNEIGTGKLMYRLINEIVHQPELISQLTCWCIPVLNPDGLAKAQESPDYLHGGLVGRFNGHEVDLNRNFPTSRFVSRGHWNFGKNYSQSREVFCGERGGSEPETQAIIRLVQQEKIDLLWVFHNAGRDVTASTDRKAQQLAQIFSQVSGYTFFTQDDWKKLKQTGTAKEWCEEQQISYLEIEGSHRWSSDWQEQKAAIFACLEKLRRI